MDLAEPEGQLNELEAITASSKVSVTFDKATSVIRATKTVYTPDGLRYQDRLFRGEASTEPGTTVQETLGGGLGNDWGTTKVEPVAWINLANVDVPDEFIDERMRLAVDRGRVGDLVDVKLVCSVESR